MRAERAFRYLASVAAAPACVQKAALYINNLEMRREALLAHELPPEVRALIESPPPAAMFVPLAHAHAYHLAVCDLIFDTEVAFLRAAYANTVRFYETPTYRALMTGMTASMFARALPRVWQQMNRGSEVDTEMRGDKQLLVRLRHPAGHVTPTIARMYGISMTASLEVCGSSDTRVDMGQFGPTETTWTAAWK